MILKNYKIKSKNYKHMIIGQGYFFNDGAQLYLIFQMFYYTWKKLGDTVKIVSWKSNGLSAEKRTTLTTTDKGTCLEKKNSKYSLPNRIIFLIMS